MFFTTAVVFTGSWVLVSMRRDDLSSKQSKRITLNTLLILLSQWDSVKVVGSGGQDQEMIRWPEDDDMIFLEEEEENDT